MPCRTAMLIKLKKTFINFIFLPFIVLISSACEPSFCDCNDNYGSLSLSQKEKCDKMADRMTSSEMRKKMKDCKNK